MIRKRMELFVFNHPLERSTFQNATGTQGQVVWSFPECLQAGFVRV